MTVSTRRSFLATLIAAVPAMALAPSAARAWTGVPAADVGMGPPTGIWAALDHVTDGTDPSTAIIAPPHFTADMRKLAGSDVTLTGYLQPVSGGFGAPKDYVLSRTPFHCPYCYTGGRGSLALASFASHAASDAGRKVTVRGTLALQDKDPGDFYFQLKNTQIV
jgi:hypothetical protein